MKSRTLAFTFWLVAFVAMSGCSSLIPYEEEFGCKRSNNMGKCISTEEAYKEMTTGGDAAPYAKPASLKDDDESDHAQTSAKGDSQNIKKPNIGYVQYLDANYKETAKLLNSSITPVISTGDTIKIVLVPNQINEKMLLSERTLYLIVENPKFIMGDYLIEKKTPISTIFGE
ncbi:TraV family lipoprotein [Thalassotalea marina]|uniref:Type IV conjugative transfer system protein TraV n=1 Tax=Thalassotalea marina TaxID=1673741 RepID=A0A919BQS0_9GAMM|nr:TraV family lipoprotein [Thalassotalea marina]GHG07082.1 hypothetical protein GCM10017161_40900 [Thalassotalea marina]